MKKNILIFVVLLPVILFSQLQWNEQHISPCIDTGDPNSSLDPDGTIADMGALYHPHEIKTYEFPNDDPPNNGWKWLCFDILDRTPDPYNIAQNMLDPMQDPSIFDHALFNQIEEPHNVEFGIDWTVQGGWQYGDHVFTSPQGYKFRTFLAYPLEIPGFRCDQETTFDIIAYTTGGQPKENWIGYYLNRIQHVYDSFVGHLDNIYSIKTQNWSVENEGGGWPDVPYTLSPGDMVIVKCYEDIDEFCWVNQQPAEQFIIEEPQSFFYEEESDYIPIYMSLDPEDLPTEIGAFVDGECQGATVVQDTSAQICAYIIGNQGSNLEFEFYYGGRSENKIIREYNVYDPETSQTEKGSIKVEKGRDSYYVSFKNEPESTPVPVKLEVSNYPNPFNPVTNIAYSLPEDSQISISIYNIKGQKVKTLVTGTQPAGSYNVSWEGKDESGKDVTSGIYFYKLKTKNNEITRKMLLLK
ncbi:MAG: T9SS type A sorting domain-containing protein [Candidatus Cloacimonetes bacterium]|nr:T9SS type A sorting domain-containing protein [Candidatus Cloacimonadota bacterium]